MKSITLVFCKVLICRCIVFRIITLTYSLATSVPFSCGIFVGQGHVCRYCQNKGILFEKRTQFHLSREIISLHLSIWDIGLLCQLCNQYKASASFTLSVFRSNIFHQKALSINYFFVKVKVIKHNKMPTSSVSASLPIPPLRPPPAYLQTAWCSCCNREQCVHTSGRQTTGWK